MKRILADIMQKSRNEAQLRFTVIQRVSGTIGLEFVFYGFNTVQLTPAVHFLELEIANEHFEIHIVTVWDEVENLSCNQPKIIFGGKRTDSCFNAQSLANITGKCPNNDSSHCFRLPSSATRASISSCQLVVIVLLC